MSPWAALCTYVIRSPGVRPRGQRQNQSSALNFGSRSRPLVSAQQHMPSSGETENVLGLYHALGSRTGHAEFATFSRVYQLDFGQRVRKSHWGPAGLTGEHAMIKSKNTESGERRYWLKVGARQRKPGKGKSNAKLEEKSQVHVGSPPSSLWGVASVGAWPSWARLPAGVRGGASSPPQPVHIAHGDGLHQDNEQQGQRGSVVIEYVEPVVARLHGEHQADDAVDKAHQTWGHETTCSPA